MIVILEYSTIHLCANVYRRNTEDPLDWEYVLWLDQDEPEEDPDDGR